MESQENAVFAQFPGVVKHFRGGMGELIWFSGGKELENYRTIEGPVEYALRRLAGRSCRQPGAPPR